MPPTPIVPKNPPTPATPAATATPGSLPGPTTAQPAATPPGAGSPTQVSPTGGPVPRVRRCCESWGVGVGEGAPDASALFDANTRLAYWVVARMRRSETWAHEDEDDMVQDALMGLWHACGRFEPERGFKFSPYAVRCIKGYVLVGHGRRAGSNRRNGRAGFEVSFDVPVDGDDSWVESFEADGPAPESVACDLALAAAAVDVLNGDDFNDMERAAILAATERGGLRRVAEATGFNRESLRRRAITARARLIARLGRAS